MKKTLFSLVLLPFLLLYALPVSAVEKEERTWQDETMYYVMTDRFHNGDNKNDKEINNHDLRAYQGGDFTGAAEKLDYLHDMGITSIIISPVFENAKGGYHGYWITDFYKTNKQFGSLKELNHLVKEAHDRDMKVIVDFPIMQVSPSHPWVKDAAKADWFVTKSGHAEEKWLGQMAVLNLENEAVKQELIKVGQWWMKKADIDGYYLSDSANAPVSFLQDFSAQLKQQQKNFFLLGGNDGKTDIKHFEKSGLDSVMNAELAGLLQEQFKNVNEPSNQSAALLKKESEESSLLLANYLDSSKTDRFTKKTVEENMFPGTRWMMALTYLYTVPGVPVVYYGSEVALNGEKGPESHRLLSFKEDQELIDHMKEIGELRQKLPALTRGSYEPIYDKDGMTVFKRQYKDETLIVAVNNSNKTQKVTIPAEELDRNKELRGLLEGGLARPEEEKFSLILDRETAEIYALTEKVGVNKLFIAALAAVYIIFMAFLYLVWKRGKASRQ
ncbi:alpha-amylase family glycosyl hydrolase [Pseudobacillus wudalianchiensis]|uniref:alpha-amylase family glycosyl hydrolase n=1 Tax=Pseudobacillus wudalianchiensis TaxID=1743143 RepID=UPI0008087F6C|nr:alpha-amylase family glycosyl hydrolase [Bacillus wudalianchiensis]